MEVIPSPGRPISAGRSTHVGHFNSTDNKSRDRSQLKCSLVTAVWWIREQGWVAERPDQTPCRSVLALAEGPTSVIHLAGAARSLNPWQVSGSQSARVGHVDSADQKSWNSSQLKCPLVTAVWRTREHGCVAERPDQTPCRSVLALAEGPNSVTHLAGPIVELRTPGRSQPVSPRPWDTSTPPITNRGTSLN